jgi:hypothetical protein
VTFVHPVHESHDVGVNHTGPLSWQQRAFAAVLAHWPAALAGESALPDPPKSGPIHVAIDLRRTVTPVAGIQAHRTAHFENRADWMKTPPRIRLEEAVIDVAASRRSDPLATFQVLADACQTRRTRPKRIAAALRARGSVAGKQLMLGLLADLDTGACSVLEREYLHRVERAHGLPEARRQSKAESNGRTAYRDADYEEFGLLVELDGRPFHDTASARDADADRDLDARVEEERTTVRITYGLVFGDACRTAERIGALLQRGGWEGTPEPCPDCPKS